MAIVTFYSDKNKETGQSLSVAAIATSMAIEHNYKILVVDTAFQDPTLEECYWPIQKTQPVKVNLGLGRPNTNTDISSGIEGLVKVISSNKTTPEIVRNYSKTVLRERLDFLQAPRTQEYDDYQEITTRYIDVLTSANRFYDYVFVDLSRKISQETCDNILQISDIVIYSLTQNMKSIERFLNLRSENDFFKKRNVMLLIGRCDQESKYNVKNITRYLREKSEISSVPYNTLFFESCSENKVIDYLLKYRKLIDNLDKNAVFIKVIKDTVNAIINKLHEVQMRA